MVSVITFETAVNIILAFLALIYWGAVFTILYHLTRFGIGTQPKRLAAIFLFGTVVLFFASVILYVRVDLNSLL